MAKVKGLGTEELNGAADVLRALDAEEVVISVGVDARESDGFVMVKHYVKPSGDGVSHHKLVHNRTIVREYYVTWISGTPEIKDYDPLYSMVGAVVTRGELRENGYKLQGRMLRNPDTGAVKLLVV